MPHGGQHDGEPTNSSQQVWTQVLPDGQSLFLFGQADSVGAKVVLEAEASRSVPGHTAPAKERSGTVAADCQTRTDVQFPGAFVQNPGIVVGVDVVVGPGVPSRRTPRS